MLCSISPAPAPPPPPHPHLFCCLIVLSIVIVCNAEGRPEDQGCPCRRQCVRCPLPVATRRLSSSTPAPPPLNLPSEVPIGVIERDESPVPNNGPSSVVIATRSSSSGSGPILVLSSSLSLVAADDKCFPHPSLDTADCNVFFMSASARIPHKCCPPSTVKDQHPDTAPSSPPRPRLPLSLTPEDSALNSHQPLP